MTDARFEDGDEAPLRLIARDGASLPVLAALVQDAILPASEMTFYRPRRRFALMLNPVSYTHLDVYKRQEFARDLLGVPQANRVATGSINAN